MANSLKPIDEQVIVITGAASGIGLASAELAAQRGARLVLAARSGQALAEIARRLQEEHDTEVVHVQCDVADREQVERVARAAIDRFGRIDTWVNNAGIGMYGRLDDSNETDSRRLFDINFWGVFNGAMAALPHLRANPNGGALINIGSEVSEAAMPLLGMYTASKHAVKGLLAPALADRMAARQVDQFHYDDPARQPQGALFVASEVTGVVGQEHGARET